MKKSKRFIALVLMALSLMAVALPGIASATTGYYNTAAVHLRSTIGVSGKSLGLVSKNATCNILLEDTLGGIDWYKVKITSHTSNSPDLYNATGWSQKRYITVNGGGSVPGSYSNATQAFGSTNLKKGDVGNYVRNVQNCLANLTYKYNSSKTFYNDFVDGDFGNNTYSAVFNYQLDRGLDFDGIVGPLTKNKLWSEGSQFCWY